MWSLVLSDSLLLRKFNVSRLGFVQSTFSNDTFLKILVGSVKLTRLWTQSLQVPSVQELAQTGLRWSQRTKSNVHD